MTYLADSLTGEPKDFAADRTNELLFVGLRGEYKNFDRLVQAVGRSEFLRDNFQIVAFGGGPFSSAERELIDEVHLTQRVRYVAGDDRDLRARYRSARAFIYPSLYEGFGLPVLEAMGCGCPVICARPRADRSEEIAGEAAAYFDPTSVTDMQRILENTLSSPERLADLRAKGAFRHSLFSWEKCAVETLEVYRTIAIDGQ